MKQYKLTAPERLAQTIQLPASKSISNRALIIYALSGGRNLPQNRQEKGRGNTPIAQQRSHLHSPPFHPFRSHLQVPV